MKPMQTPQSDTPENRTWCGSPDAACYAADFRPVKCSCGGEKFREIVKEHIDGRVCEFEVRCINCDALTGYWAYGYYDPSFAKPHNAPVSAAVTQPKPETQNP